MSFFLSILAMFGLEKWSIQYMFRPNCGTEKAKTSHLAIVKRPLSTTIYFKADNFIKTADIPTIQDYMYMLNSSLTILWDRRISLSISTSEIMSLEIASTTSSVTTY